MNHARSRRRAGAFTAVLLASGLGIAAAVPASPPLCGGPARTLFTGHSIPLDESLVPTPLVSVDAFPSLPALIQPVLVTHAGDGSNRLFVVQRQGIVVSFPNDPSASSVDVYLDLTGAGGAVPTGTVDASQPEMGLLGLAFDPEFAEAGSPHAGALYVYYSTHADECRCKATASCPTPLDHCSKVVRFMASSVAATSVDPATAFELLEIEQPYWNHNGGMLAFGPGDGMLYIAAGDGGSSGDPQQNGQNTTTPLGALLRIDAHAPAPHIPVDNPFAGQCSGREIWHYGLRNPWRFSFDSEPPHDLWIGDVGQNLREEIDFVPGTTPGGLDFGWNLCEGTLDFSGSGCATPGLVGPVLEHAHPQMISITGGAVYRGRALPQIYGAYLYSDYGSAGIYAWDRVMTSAGLGVPEKIASASGVSSFGEDEAGEIYHLLYFSGRLHRLAPASGGGSGFPLKLSQTGFFTDTASLTPAPGMLEFAVASPLWSDRASKRRWLALPGATRIGFHARGAFDFPVGTALVKHFELPATGGQTRRLETRVFVRQSSGEWLGFSYRWDESQTDADLLTRSVVETVDVEFEGVPGQQLWTHPSPEACLGCHTEAAGRVLGPRARQLNRDGPAGGGNQLEAWNCLGLFDTDIGPAAAFGHFAAPEDLAASTPLRARSLLASNCSLCHQPGAPAPGGMDMRFDPLLGQMQLIGVVPSQGGLGLSDPERIKAGVHAESVLWHRVQSEDALLRMAPGTRIPDSNAVLVLADWIDLDLVRPDSDGDLEPDASDDCPSIANPDQSDADSDGIGDLCDPDAVANLVATPASANPRATSLGASVAFRVDVGNAGTGAAPASQVTLYLSDDAIFDAASDRLVADCFVAALPGSAGASCSDTRARVPIDLAAIPEGETRSFYYAACADALGLVFEADETDNCNLDPAPVVVPEPSGPVRTLTALVTLCLLGRLRRRACGQALAV